MREHPNLLYFLVVLVIGLSLIGPILSAQGGTQNDTSESTDDTSATDDTSESTDDTSITDDTSESIDDTSIADDTSTATDDTSIADDTSTATDDTSIADDTSASTDDTSITDDTSAAASTAPIMVTSPNGGETWVIGTIETITWTSNDVAGPVRIDLSRDGSSTWINIIPYTTNDGEQNWKITSPATTQARIRIVSTFNSTVLDISDADFTISSP